MAQETQRTKILLLGPLPIPGDHLGGAKAAFAQMLSDVSKLNWIEVDVVNLSRAFRGAGRTRRVVLNLLGLLKTIGVTLSSGRSASVWVLNVSPVGSFTLIPILATIAKLYGKPLVVRMFGGSFTEDYDSLSRMQQMLYDLAFRSCSLVTMETKKLIRDLSHFQNVRWFPNTRDNPLVSSARTDCRRFIFLSQIREEKGVLEILDALSQIDAQIRVDFYGSLVDQRLGSRINDTAGATYCGELAPEQVYEVLGQYDALLLPSYWQGEGLPGVIVEAFQSGIPVIATRWNQIPELVEHDHNGLLVEPKNSGSLADAMTTLTHSPQRYVQLCLNARESGEMYRSNTWNELFFGWCVESLTANYNES